MTFTPVTPPDILTGDPTTNENGSPPTPRLTQLLQLFDRCLKVLGRVQQIEVLAVPGAGQPDEQTSPALEDRWAICCGKDPGEEALKHEFALQFIDRSAALLGLCVQPIAH